LQDKKRNLVSLGTAEEIENALNSAGLEIVAIYGDLTENAPTDTEERVFYVTKKK
jgi:hypothetical protein